MGESKGRSVHLDLQPSLYLELEVASERLCMPLLHMCEQWVEAVRKAAQVTEKDGYRPAPRKFKRLKEAKNVERHLNLSIETWEYCARVSEQEGKSTANIIRQFLEVALEIQSERIEELLPDCITAKVLARYAPELSFDAEW